MVSILLIVIQPGSAKAFHKRPTFIELSRETLRRELFCEEFTA